MKPDIKNKQTDELFEAILTLKSKEECYKFFTDVCTVNEIKALTQRYHVAKLLMDSTTYSEIVEKTGASTATISRVKRSIDFGEGGYELAMNRIKNK